MKRDISGIQIPDIATSAELQSLVRKIFEANENCYAATARALDVSAAEPGDPGGHQDAVKANPGRPADVGRNLVADHDRVPGTRAADGLLE